MGEEGDAEVRDLVSLYLEDAPALIEDVKLALEQNDVESFRRAAHSFKSSCANIGAFQLQGICVELEEIGKSGSLDQVGTQLSQLDEEYAQVRLALTQFVA